MNKHQYMSEICALVAQKGTCPRAKVGAVFINDDYEILSTGYNGAPRGFPHCSDSDCLIEGGHCITAIHAEQNAIIQAAKRGTSLRASTLYVTHTPCAVCAKMLINLGVSRIIVRDSYRVEDTPAVQWLQKAGIEIIPWA